jgi:hypothetical protein
MKFIPFKEHTHKIPAESRGEEIQFFKQDNAVIFCLQLSEEEMIRLRNRNGKIWIRSFTPFPPPIELTLLNPFKPLPENEKDNPESTSNDQQYTEGNNKLSE